MKKVLLPVLFLALALGLAPSAVLTQPAPTPISPLTGSEQFVLQYAPPSGCSVNCFTTSDAIKAFAGGGGGGNTINLTADTNIAAGSSVSVNSSGHAVQTWGPAPNVADTATLFTGQVPFFGGPLALALSASQFVAFQGNGGPIFGPGAVAFSLSGETISVGTPSVSGGLQNAQSAAALDSSHLVYAYLDAGNLYVQAGLISENTISLGSAVEASADGGSFISNNLRVGFAILSSTKFVLAYSDSAAQNWYVVGTVSGTTITLGTPSDTGLPSGVNINLIPIAMSASEVILAWVDNDSNLVTAAVGAVSGTSISLGTPVTITGAYASASTPGPASSPAGVYGIKLDTTHFCLTYNIASGADIYQGFAAVGSISDTSITFGSQVQVAPWWASPPPIVVALSANELVFYGGSSTPTVYSLSGTALSLVLAGVAISVPNSAPIPSSNNVAFNANPANLYGGTNISPLFPPLAIAGSSAFIWEDGLWNIYGETTAGIISPPVAHPGINNYAFLPISDSQVLALLVDGAANLLARVINFEPINASPPIGFAASAITSGNSGAITISGVASGFSGLTPGDAYYHNGDGSIVTANTGHKAGVALTSSTLLIQNYLLKRDLDPASNDNSPAFVNEAA